MGGCRTIGDISIFSIFYYGYHIVDRKTKYKGFKNDHVL